MANPVRVRTSSGWQDLALVGEQGPEGPEGPQGVQGPQGIQGPQGLTGSGSPGAVWRSGSGAPAGALGIVGDWYLNDANGDVYEKTGASSYTLRDNIQGPQGIQGVQGIQGTTGSQGIQGVQGTPGEKWFSGSGAPAGGLAGTIVGDWYLDTATGDVYAKTGASAWSLRGNIKGPTGTTGSTGSQGIQGIQGIQGVTGTPGEKWFSGAGAPAGATGIVGDWYVDLSSGDVHEKTGASAWTLRGNIRGPQGIQGTQGIQGIQGTQGPTGQAEAWYSGSGAPAAGTGVVGDWYLNTATGDVHEKTGASSWTLIGNIKGPQGIQGPTGSTGPPGTVYDSDQIGTVKAYAGTAIPANWRLCDGAAVTEAAYPELATALGKTGTFNLPDLRNKFIYGASAPGPYTFAPLGEATVALAAAEMPSHRHTVSSHDHGTYAGLTGYFDANHDHAFATSGGAGAHAHTTYISYDYVQRTLSGTATNLVTGVDPNWNRIVDLSGPSSTDGGHDHGGTTNQTTQNHRHALVAQSPATDWKGGSGSPQSDSAGAAHNNLPPYVLIAFIIKVTGPMIDAGGALVGPAGVKGERGAVAGRVERGHRLRGRRRRQLLRRSRHRLVPAQGGGRRRRGTPVADTTNWELIASGGSIGEDGAVAVYEQAATPTEPVEVGAVWIDTDAEPPAWASGIPLVTSLPTSPVDGQEVYYQSAAMAADGVVWHLRYRASSSSAYKWEIIGQPPPLISLFGSDNYVAPAYGSYFQPGGAAVGVTVPLAGDYDVTGLCTGQMNTTGAASHHLAIFKGGVQQTSDQFAWFAYAAQFDKGQTSIRTRLTAVAAATVLEVRAKINRGGAETFYLPRAELAGWPVRVSG